MNISVTIPFRSDTVRELCRQLGIAEATAIGKLRVALRQEIIGELEQRVLVLTRSGPQGRRSTVEIETEDWIDDHDPGDKAIVLRGLV